MARSPLKPPPYGAREPLSAYARRFEIPIRTAKRWATAGKIPKAQKVGCRWFVCRSKVSDAFGLRAHGRKTLWSSELLTEWDKKVALAGMKILERPLRTRPEESFFDSTEYLGATFHLAGDIAIQDNYTFGKLVADSEFLKVANLLSEVFPRFKRGRIAAALLAGAFHLKPFDSTGNVVEAERRVTKQKLGELPRDSDLLSDLPLTEFEAVRRRFSMKAFAEGLGVSRAAVYKSFKKKGVSKPAERFFAPLNN
jgi:hypothetical protein